MTRFSSILAAAILQAGAAWACAPQSDADIPYLEGLKDAFLEADYVEFAREMGPFFPDMDRQFEGLFGPIQNVFPDGFVRCRTVLQRREAPGFYQDLVLYYPVSSPETPLALLLVAVDPGDGIKLLEFNYNTSISVVLSELK